MKLKGFFNDFGFWKFIIITIISAAFSAGVATTAMRYKITALAKDYTDLSEQVTINTSINGSILEYVGEMRTDIGVIKNDIEWIRGSLDKLK